LGSGPERAAKDIPLPLGHPIGLADQRKPVVKFSLIIVNGAAAMIKASGQAPRLNSARKTIDLFRPAAARIPPGKA
jgi:hypothetical protein